jgi:spore coat polysaccharide biosynthesis protein SpsF
MKIIASIQARLGSSRLPGKVLKKINGKPMLYWHVERIRKARLIDDVIIATTVNPADDEIVEFCNEYDISYFRGSEDDVLDRVASMVEKNKIDIHVELFGDSPLTDPHIIDEYVGYLLKHYDSLDFVSNSIETTYPPGQEVLVYKGEVLIDANKRVLKTDPLREHVSIHIYKHPDLYRVKNLPAPTYYNFPDVFMEVDTPEDFVVVETIINHFHNNGQSHFSLSQILDFLNKNLELTQVNQNVERRWKEFRKDEN